MELKPGYKQTEVGVIPEDWEMTNLYAVSKVPMQNGVFFKPSHKGSGIKLINVGDLYNQIPINSNSLELFDASANEKERFKVENGDLFFTRSSVVPVGIAHCNIYQSTRSEQVVFDSHVIRVRPNTKKVLSLYLYRFVVSSIARKYLISHSKTGTMTTIDQAVLGRCPVLIPPTKAEQTAIAIALSDTDALIQSLTRLITKKRQIKQGAMQTLLTGKVRLSEFNKGVGYKQTEVGVFPLDWEVYTIPELMSQGDQSIKIGPFGSALKKEFLSNEGYKIYGQENVYEKDMSIGDRYINRERYLKLKTCEILRGDFLISMMGTVGKCHIVPEVFDIGIMDSHLLRLRIDQKKLSSRLLLQLFQTPIVFNQIRKLSVGGIMEGLSSKIIKQIKLALPPVVEQMKISKVLNEMDAEIAALEAKLAKYRQIKQGMMQNLLTGKIRLI